MGAEMCYHLSSNVLRAAIPKDKVLAFAENSVADNSRSKKTQF